MTAAVQQIPTARKPALTMEIVNVSPSIAEKWLGKNTRNRHVRTGVVTAYADAMKRGEWMVTGEAVKFAVTGELLDGQHRLHAVIKSEKTVPLLVVKGLTVETQDLMDTGKARTASDMLQLNGFGNPAVAAAAAKILILWESKRFYSGNDKQLVSHRQIHDYCTANSTLAFTSQRAGSIAKAADLRPSVVAMTMYELMKIDDEKALYFFDRLADGVELPAGSPILALRERMRAMHNDRTRIPMEAAVGLVFRAWNAWRAGRKIQSLPLYKSGQLITCPEPK